MERTNSRDPSRSTYLNSSQVLNNTNISDETRKRKAQEFTRQRISILSSGSQTQDNQVLEHRKRLEDPLRIQKENFPKWNQEDFEQTKTTVLEQDFTNQDSNEEYLWEYANFNPGGSYECPAPQIINNWTISKLTGTSRGLLIRSQIIKTLSQVALRSMAAQITVKGRLFGNSMFWIFTRVKDNIEVNKPICILKKMPDSQRVFCVFGQMVDRPSLQQDNNDTTVMSEIGNSTLPGVTNKMQFKFFKNQEIPEFFYNQDTDSYMKAPLQKAQQEDYVDINVTLIDNGDDKLCLQVGLNEKKTLNLVCQMYMPVFEQTKVMFAGSGHATYLKEVKIRQTYRQEYFKSGLKEGHFECCSIF